MKTQIMNIEHGRFQMARISSLALLLLGLWIGFSGCAKTSDPEHSGGEILAMPERCEFRISGDDKWLQYVGEQSPYHQSDERWPSRQRQSFLVDLETGEHYSVEPDLGVRRRIAEGLGPDGLGCFSPDHTRLYFRTSDWGRGAAGEQEAADERMEPSEGRREADAGSQKADEGSQEAAEGRQEAAERNQEAAERRQAPAEMQDDTSQSGSATSISVPGRQATRYHYVVDLTEKPFVIRETDHMECSERPDAVKPDIEVRQVSDKRIEIHSRDGRKLASHRPRGRLSRRIGIRELHDRWDTNQWESDYSLSPDGNHLAYRISETGLIGFAGPTAGYMLDLSQRGRQGPDFLAASVYAMQWDGSGYFYACNSHSEHKTVIARWHIGF